MKQSRDSGMDTMIRKFGLAALLAAGCFTRVISIVLGLHLPGIAWTAGGAVGVRDATLAVRLWALAAGKTDIWMLDASVAKK